MENISDLLKSMSEEVFRRLQAAEAGSGRKTWPAAPSSEEQTEKKEERT